MNITEILRDEKTLLRQTKSLCSLKDEGIFRGNGAFYADKRSRVGSESSEPFVVHHAGSETSLGERAGRVGVDLAHLTHLEQKMDRLTDVFLEQCRLLSSIKEEMQHSREAVERSGNMHISQLFAQLANNNVGNQPISLRRGDDSRAGLPNSRARTLLDAIEAHAHRDMGDAISSFLQSDELTERVVSATAASVREVVSAAMARDVAAVYVPVLQRAQRRLARHATRALEDAFVELEEHCALAARHVCRASRQLQRALDRHQAALDRRPPTKLIDSLRQTAERVLDSEMKQWRQKVLETMSSDAGADSDWRAESPAPSVDADNLLCGPGSPLSADSDHSPIDRLMQAAVINKQMEDGDVNGSFERALCSMDLSLVVAACRAAPPARVFAPCRLRAPVLLALLQQLATDMLSDTQLKCRYLEEAIISLNTTNPDTRAHLPTVVGEVRKHLMKFLASYPNHVASRRITLIAMAADNLLK